MNDRLKTWGTNGATNAFVALLFLLAILTGIGIFAWWAFTWSTHTLAWAIFIFGSLLGSVKVAK